MKSYIEVFILGKIPICSLHLYFELTLQTENEGYLYRPETVDLREHFPLNKD